MKKSLICLTLALALLCGGTLVTLNAPTRDDKKPIVVDKMCYAEEIVEYESDEYEVGSFEIRNSVEENESESKENCENCACVCVTGKSTLSLSPDSAKICAVIEILDTDITKSKEANFEAFDKVVEALKKDGISEEKIVLENFRCCPSYDYSNGRTLQGYMTTTTLCVEVDELANLKSYIDTMTENGVTCVCNVQYMLSSMEEEYSNALASAFANAQEKASKLLGRDDLRLVRVREERVFAPFTLCRNYVDGVSNDIVGKIEIEACVVAVFETDTSATAV